MTQACKALRLSNLRRPLAYSLLVAVVALTVRIPLLNVPFERDEGEYAYISWRIDCGDVPYRDAFDQKPPGVFAAYWLIRHTLGEGVRSIHLGLALVVAVTALALLWVGTLWVRLAPAAAGAVLFALMSCEKAYLGQAANTELFMILPLILSVGFLAVAMRRDTAVLWGAAGLSIGIATLFKQVAAPQVILAIAAAAITVRRLRGRWSTQSILARWAWIAGGVLLPWAVTTIIFMWAGGLRAMVECVWLHNFRYASSTPVSEASFLFRRAFLSIVKADALPLLLALAGAGILLARWRDNWLIMAWFGLSFAGVCVGGYFRPHYFVQILPPIGFLAGVGVYRLGDILPARLGRSRRKLIFVSIFALAVLAWVVNNRKWLAGADPNQICVDRYSWSPFPESEPIGHFLHERTRPGDTIFIHGSEPQIFYHARRKSASRYIFIYPLTGLFTNSLDMQKEAVEDMESAKPAFFLLVRTLGTSDYRPQTDRYMFTSLCSITEVDYSFHSMCAITTTRPSPILLASEINTKALMPYLKDPTTPLILIYRRKTP